MCRETASTPVVQLGIMIISSQILIWLCCRALGGESFSELVLLTPHYEKRAAIAVCGPEGVPVEKAC